MDTHTCTENKKNNISTSELVLINAAVIFLFQTDLNLVFFSLNVFFFHMVTEHQTTDYRITYTHVFPTEMHQHRCSGGQWGGASLIPPPPHPPSTNFLFCGKSKFCQTTEISYVTTSSVRVHAQTSQHAPPTPPPSVALWRPPLPEPSSEIPSSHKNKNYYSLTSSRRGVDQRR